VTCLEVRDRLTEHSLGVLSKADAREVERHLEWCPGCRKEASELLEGAASMALILPVADPPTSLEGRIVERFRMAAGRAPIPSRRRLWVLVAATLTAAVLISGMSGWAIAKRGSASLEELVTTARQQKQDLSSLIADLNKRGLTLTGTLTSPSDGKGFGTAIIFSAPRIDDFVLVDIPVRPEAAGPFKVQLVGGVAIDAGQMSGREHLAALKWFHQENLDKITTVTVIDQSTGAVVLTGQLTPYTAP
jgi:hypothetical protein